MTEDYRDRNYLALSEAARLTGLSVRELQRKIRAGELPAARSTSGQYRLTLESINPLLKDDSTRTHGNSSYRLDVNGTEQHLMCGDSRDLSLFSDESVQLMVTSPPYFNAKKYSRDGDLGDIHELDDWFHEITMVWSEVYRLLRPGRKAFVNIMNLPVRRDGSFHTLNLVGRTIDAFIALGFIFKRDIVWQKTNGVRAHFGSYPYPGGILINHMHEFILEFEKPAPRGYKKYTGVTSEQRNASRLDRDFWLQLKNSDVWVMHPELSGDGRKHAAPFPLELPMRLIRAYSFVGETVLDPFMGSGTTLVAAARTVRNGIGVDVNRDYVDESRMRIMELDRVPGDAE